MTSRRRGAIAAAVVAVLLVTALVLALTRHHATSGSASSSSNTGSSATAATAAKAPAGMATVAYADLPAEAQLVLKKIDSGATLKYRQDGSVFSNRERRLPSEPGGYYREYTVPTPGASDRGARRIIVGQNGELYYTSDHYASFQWIQRGASP